MEKKETDAVQTFDTLYTTNQIQIMKILLPFCDERTRRSLVVMIKFMELQYTISFTRKHPETFREAPLPFSLNDVCERIKAYCPPQLCSMLEQFQAMQNAFAMYEEMKQMMELFQDSGGTQANPFASLAGLGDLAGDGEPSPSSAAKTSGENSRAFADTGVPSSGADPLSLLLGFLSPDQQELFQMLRSDPGAPNAQAADDADTDTQAASTEASNAQNTSAKKEGTD